MFQYIADTLDVKCSNSLSTSTVDGIPTGLPTSCANDVTLQSILGIVFGVLAAVAVLIIVIQGIRFILSNGDPQKASDARRGVIYSVVGLVVALLAEAIVQVLLGRITG